LSFAKHAYFSGNALCVHAKTCMYKNNINITALTKLVCVGARGTLIIQLFLLIFAL